MPSIGQQKGLPQNGALKTEGTAAVSGGDLSGRAGEELYSLFLEGDEGAFEELVALFREGLTRYIYKITNDARDAEELMIDAFAELAADTKYSGRSSLKTYLFAIGRNIALRHMKKYRRGGTVPIELIVGEPVDADDLPEFDFIRKEERRWLQAAMPNLKQEHREVLHLIYFEDMSYADAGAAMRKTAKQIEYLARVAKASLKNILESEAGGP
ncbi:MAG: sigma-70 family RNA polymerase sigma factor [Clostridiales Family XIII bacterium]|jgi:RNA polymerase sigma-70 factor (ECF subfamily)|nr:sigma-70 family RNA polymerase sigma factor [Clostridiales Family XIII bacterium]